MFIYSGKWQESQVFHRYVQRDINSSHLLHKAHSAVTVQGGGGGGWTKRTHTVHWAQTHLLNPPQKIGAEVRWWRQRGEGDEEGGGCGGLRFRLIFKYKRTCTNRIASRHCAPIFTVVITGSQNHSMAGPSTWDIQGTRAHHEENKVSAMRAEKNQWSVRGRDSGVCLGEGVVAKEGLGLGGGGPADTCVECCSLGN